MGRENTGGFVTYCSQGSGEKAMRGRWGEWARDPHTPFSPSQPLPDSCTVRALIWKKDSRHSALLQEAGSLLLPTEGLAPRPLQLSPRKHPFIWAAEQQPPLEQ